MDQKRRLVAALCAAFACAAAFTGPVRAQARITGQINDADRVVLRGNVHPLAAPANDAGPVDPALRLERMVLTLMPSFSQQAALNAFMAGVHDPASPLYHHWLTPADFAERFSPAPADVARITAWLKTHGFTVDDIPAGRRHVVFSGTAGQVRATFATEIHRYNTVRGPHIANASDPQIPRLLAGIVGGVLSLHDFRHRPHLSRAVPLYDSGGSHYLGAADYAAIYHLSSLYNAGTTGAGQTIAVISRSNIYPADQPAFRTAMGLASNPIQVVLNGADPGQVSGDVDEVTLDTEWSGAVARGATVKLIVSPSTQSSDGIDLSAIYAVNNNVADILSLSYGSCESSIGQSAVQSLDALWQQAAAQGMSVFVSSGDSGAAGCDGASSATAAGGRAVNGLCTSPSSVCVGGTLFNDTGNPALYWAGSNPGSPQYGGTALGYIPEVAWNESASVAGGSNLWSSGGGASIYFAKPSWQAGTGVPADNARDVPDVSLAAAGHDGYIVLLTNAGTPTPYVFSGTSAAAPSFAGMMALVNQANGGRQGNPNTRLYPLAASTPSAFHDVTSGNNTVPGQAGFSAGVGYDLVTGLGSVDAAVLVANWSNTVSLNPTSVSVGAGAGNGNTSLATTQFWSVQSNAAWLTLTSAASGTGNATIAYSYAATNTVNPRSGMITVAGKTLTVNQAGATPQYSLPTSSASPAYTGGPGNFALTATPADAPWTATSDSAWLAVNAPASGTGSGTINYTVADNTGSTSARTGHITVGGQTFTVNQAAGTGVVAPPPSSGGGGGGGGCTIARGSATDPLFPLLVIGAIAWIGSRRRTLPGPG